MKNIVAIYMTALLTTLPLFSAPKAVVFDFGGIMTDEPKKEAVFQFIRSTFSLSETEFEKINLEKREAVKAGKSDEQFWLQFAKEKGMSVQFQSQACDSGPGRYGLAEKGNATHQSQQECVTQIF